MSRQRQTISPKWFFQIVDAMALLAAFAAANLLVPTLGPVISPTYAELYEPSLTFLLILALPLWLLLLDWGEAYIDPVRTSYGEITGRMLRISLVALACIALLVFLAKERSVSRLFVFSFGALSFLGLTGVRFVEKRYYDARRQAGYYLDRALVIGSAQGIQVLDQFIEAGGFSNDVRIVPCTIPAGMLRPEPGAPGPQPEAWFGDLRRALRSQPINEVVLILNSRTETWLKQVAEICVELGQPLRIIPDSVLRYRLFTSSNLTVYPDSFIGLPALLLLRSRRKPGYEFVKRLMDLVVSGLLLILLAPLLAVVALAVKLSSPGPIFYRWGVLGQNNREFTGYKFRTMVANADQLKAELLARNEMSGPVFKLKDDPRVTPVGRFLRKYSLDELPQLWSVLKGDMSLVGPRPPLKSEFDRFEFWHARKLSVRPGMTCLWQVSGRNEIRDFDEWVRLDLEYIDRRSLRLDLEILGRTALAVLRGTGR